jgi:hypothetical protein
MKTACLLSPLNRYLLPAVQPEPRLSALVICAFCGVGKGNHQSPMGRLAQVGTRGKGNVMITDRSFWCLNFETGSQRPFWTSWQSCPKPTGTSLSGVTTAGTSQSRLQGSSEVILPMSKIHSMRSIRFSIEELAVSSRKMRSSRQGHANPAASRHKKKLGFRLHDFRRPRLHFGVRRN